MLKVAGRPGLILANLEIMGETWSQESNKIVSIEGCTMRYGWNIDLR
jgi:hypothetical protein